MAYVAWAFFAPSAQLDIAEIAKATLKSIQQLDTVWSLARKERTVMLRCISDSWMMLLEIEDGPEVIVDARKIATGVAEDRPDAGLIAACTQRVFVACGADPQMDHFNDYLSALHTLERLGSVLLFDHDRWAFI